MNERTYKRLSLNHMSCWERVILLRYLKNHNINYKFNNIQEYENSPNRDYGIFVYDDEEHYTLSVMIKLIT